MRKVKTLFFRNSQIRTELLGKAIMAGVLLIASVSPQSEASITSMFLFSCIPVCLLPQPEPPSPLLRPLHFPFFLIPFPASLSRSLSPSLHSPSPSPLICRDSSRMSPPSWTPYPSLPEELYSVADVFLAGLVKNKSCCFVWSCSRAFVSVTSFLLSGQQEPALRHCHKSSCEKKKKKKRGVS